MITMYMMDTTIDVCIPAIPPELLLGIPLHILQFDNVLAVQQIRPPGQPLFPRRHIVDLLAQRSPIISL